MKVNLNISLESLRKTLFALLHRFHAVIFVIVVLGGLAVVVLLLNNTIIASGEPNDYTPATNTTTFDQTTIDRIEELKTRDQSIDISVSPGVRVNPFVE